MTPSSTFSWGGRYKGATCLLIAAFGCGSSVENGRDPSTPEDVILVSRVSTEETGSKDGPHQHPTDPAETAAAVDLLHAVRSDLAVSSVYRRRAQQVYALVDGDLQTAWNSRSGDLVGAWIDVRLPQEATVESIALTVGFTKDTANRNLFESNHRITKVRVLRDGTEVGTFDLDPDNRALQTLAVSGPGGVYRIEVVEVREGSRSDWRETCISELRVRGRAPDARPGERFPRGALRELPAPRPEPGTGDRADVSRLHRQATYAFREAWQDVLIDINERAQDSGEPEASAEERERFRRTHQQVFRRAAELVDWVDEVHADGLRKEAAFGFTEPTATLSRPWAHAMNRLDGAMHAVADWLDDDQARCRWDRVHLGLRLRRLQGEVAAQTVFAYMEIAEQDMAPTKYDISAGPARRAASQDLNRLERLGPLIEEAADSWSENSRGMARRLLRLPLEELPVPTDDLRALRAALPRAREACGW